MDSFRDLVRDTQQRFGAITRLQEEPGRFRVRVERHGVAVTVAPGGGLVDLSLSSAAMRLGPDELAETILRSQREGVHEANRRYAAAVDEATGRAFDVSALVEHSIRDAA
jgi:hypothetical protein